MVATTASIRLVVFLGNPGNQYQYTRHNAGFLLAEHLPFSAGLSWQKKFKGEYADYLIGGRKISFLKPLTFMNKCGESIAAAAAFFKLSREQILIVHDDLELPFGEFALKQGGGLAGHNGLRSAAQLLGGKDFFRFRIGIGRPSRGSPSSYVLSKFSDEEAAELPDLLDKTARELTGALER